MQKRYLNKLTTILSLIIVFAMTIGVALGVIDLHTLSPAYGYAQEGAESASDDYYANVEALDDNVIGTEFRSALSNLITTTHTTLTTYYTGTNNLNTVFKTSDTLQEGYVTWFYTGTISTYNGVMGSTQGATSREHIWPKKGGNAYKDTESNVGSDAHHLRPVEASFNTKHSDSQFDEVEAVVDNIVEEMNSINYSNLCYLDKNKKAFMPGVGYRGATARILMYVQTRWGDLYTDDNGCGLKFTTETNSTNPKLIGNIATLMKWHLEEPPTEEEKLRNEAVAKIQGNRNPFIDHPEYAERIYCNDGEEYNDEVKAVVGEYSGDEAIESITLNKTAATTHIGERVFLSASLMPSNALKDLKWESSNTAVATVDSTGIVTAKSAGTTEIKVYSESNPTKKATATITIVALQDISIEGTPSVTEYQDGFSFDHTGLKVIATYTNNDTEDVTAQCQWLDANTRQTTLSGGTTSIICKYQDKELTINGITVQGAIGNKRSIIINTSCVGSIDKYNWYTWTKDGISGQIYTYKSGTNFQMNNDSKKAEHAYMFNTTALPGKLLSITIKLGGTANTNSKNFSIYTSSTPYTADIQTKYPTVGNGTNHGEKEVTTNGTTWNLNTTDRYFSINYTNASGVVYFESIEIVYAECVNHAYGDWTTTKEPTATEDGEKTRSCTICGHTETQKIDALGTSGGDGNQGGNNTGGNTGEDNTPDVTYTAQDFQNAVKAIESASTPEEKQEAITYAETIYSSLSFSDKTSSAVIEAYNSLDAQRKALDDMLADTDNGLSGGAIAGIVIGCVAFMAIVTAVVIFVVRAKRKKDDTIGNDDTTTDKDNTTNIDDTTDI